MAERALIFSCPVFALVQLVERQERHDALAALAVEDDLLGAAQHTLHGLQVQTLARHLRRLLVFLVDFEEARRLSRRLGDRLLLIALGRLQDALSFAPRLGDDLVGVGERLVLQALPVGTGGLHIAEGVDHLVRRVHLLQLDLVDADAGAIVVQHVLHELLHGLLGLLARLGQDGRDVGLADDLAHDALGHLFHGLVGFLDIEQVLCASLMRQ